jgi:hypothetical protein
VLAGLVGIARGDRRERGRWLRDAQWQARSRRWKRGEFRKERTKLGRMAAAYLGRAREIAQLPEIEQIGQLCIPQIEAAIVTISAPNGGSGSLISRAFVTKSAVGGLVNGRRRRCAGLGIMES